MIPAPVDHQNVELTVVLAMKSQNRHLYHATTCVSPPTQTSPSGTRLPSFKTKTLPPSLAPLPKNPTTVVSGYRRTPRNGTFLVTDRSRRFQGFLYEHSIISVYFCVTEEFPKSFDYVVITRGKNLIQNSVEPTTASILRKQILIIISLTSIWCVGNLFTAELFG